MAKLSPESFWEEITFIFFVAGLMSLLVVGLILEFFWEGN